MRTFSPIWTARTRSDITWHGRRLNDPAWGDPGAQVLAFTLAGTDETEEHPHILLNMSGRVARMELPAIPERSWYCAVDTSKPSPADIVEAANQPKIGEYSYGVSPRSVAVLEAR